MSEIVEQPARPRGGVPRRFLRRGARCAWAVCALLGLLCSSAACSAGARKAKDELRLTVPEVFYLHRPGARTQVPDRDRVAFQVQVEKGRTHVVPDRQQDRLVIEVDDRQQAVRLQMSGSRCTGDAVRVSCRVGPGYTTGADGGAVPIAVKGSKAGADAMVSYRLTTADGQVREARTRVVVGEPVLQLQWPERITGVPGGVVTLPLVIRNVGETAVDGVALGMDYPPLVPRLRNGNCRYWKLLDERKAVCRFPGVRIRPGEAVTFAPALQFKVPTTRQMRFTVREQAWPLALGPVSDAGWPTGGERGDDVDLKPRPVSASPTGQDDFSTESTAWTTVDTDTSADYTAVGGALRGRPGTERRITLGVRNNGPGELGRNHVVKVEFSVPSGSLVVKEPMTAIDVDAYEPLCDHTSDGGTTQYVCELDAPAADRTSTVGFTVRLGGPATGRVRLLGVTAQGYHDSHPDNNSVPVPVLPE